MVTTDMFLEREASAIDNRQFRQLCHMLASIFHYNFHPLIETTKFCYAPIAADADTRH